MANRPKFDRQKPVAAVGRFGILAAALLALLLQGCAVAPGKGAKASAPQVDNKTAASQASLLQSVGNYSGLIALYKGRLKATRAGLEQDGIRLSLAQAYLQSGDPDSALFHLDRVLEAGRGNRDYWLEKSRALMALNRPEPALQAARSALTLDSGGGDIHNQLGLIFAEQGNYSEARRQFDQARGALFDDVAVKNNLAMVDILQQRYPQAVARLMSLYRSGQADQQVRANLSLALARGGQLQEFLSVNGDSGLSRAQQLGLFRILQQLDLKNRAGGFALDGAKASVEKGAKQGAKQGAQAFGKQVNEQGKASG